MPDSAHKLVWFVPEDALDRTRDAVFAAGAGCIGDYERCSWYTPGTGTFLAQPGADPAIGEVGKEAAQVVRALVEAHPYEEVAFELYPLVELDA